MQQIERFSTLGHYVVISFGLERTHKRTAHHAPVACNEYFCGFVHAAVALFVVVKCLEAMFFYQAIAFGRFII